MDAQRQAAMHRANAREWNALAAWYDRQRHPGAEYSAAVCRRARDEELAKAGITIAGPVTARPGLAERILARVAPSRESAA